MVAPARIAVPAATLHGAPFLSHPLGIWHPTGWAMTGLTGMFAVVVALIT
ncbi:MAG: hypothetical protein H0V96_09350 [Acidimicrobiia bacterium]|nr:hypothetical protein [Acidimicrobiia bacterium]